MNVSIKFPVPALNDDAHDLYAKLYGDAGERFIGILASSPDEIAVISRLIAYLDEKTKEVS